MDLPRTLRAALPAALCVLGLAACRGGISEKPPIHPVLDMDFQQKVLGQSALEFAPFADGRGMRQPPQGTVHRAELADDALQIYKNDDDSYVTENPVPATRENVLRGQERYDIHCAVCHDRSGAGNGLALQRAKRIAPAAFNYMVPDLGKEPRLQEAEDGYLFEVITNGKGTMPAYGHQVPPADRWKIVHYLRVLQARFE